MQRLQMNESMWWTCVCVTVEQDESFMSPRGRIIWSIWPHCSVGAGDQKYLDWSSGNQEYSQNCRTSAHSFQEIWPSHGIQCWSRGSSNLNDSLGVTHILQRYLLGIIKLRTQRTKCFTYYNLALESRVWQTSVVKTRGVFSLMAVKSEAWAQVHNNNNNNNN